MSLDLDTPTTDAPRPGRPAALPWPRVFYWSVRRELWEHRVIYLAPLIGGSVAFAGFLISLVTLPHALQKAATAPPSHDMSIIAVPYAFAAFAAVMTGLVVSALYCMGALHGERRDRGMLFWKSLPVSDATTVAAKAAIPLIVMPPIVIVLVLVVHALMLTIATLVVLIAGMDPQLLWAQTPVLKLDGMLLSGVPALTLWYAPLFGWLMLVSAWAKRVPALWALAPPLALALVERLALGTSVIWSWLVLRIAGPFMDMFERSATKVQAAAAHTVAHPVAAANPLTWDSPHLWIGVALALVFFAVAARLRRSRDPI